MSSRIVRISAIKVGQSEFNADINYNLFYNNPQISNNLFRFNPDTTIYYTADPMFENQDSNNFLLQMFSPLINAGDPNILDVDGSRSDVGLYGGPYGQSYEYKDLPPKKPWFTLRPHPQPLSQKERGVQIEYRNFIGVEVQKLTLILFHFTEAETHYLSLMITIKYSQESIHYSQIHLQTQQAVTFIN
jgi:hypothetical protein